MEKSKISDREAMERIGGILKQMNPDSPFATAVQRVFADFADLASTEDAEAEADPAAVPSALDKAMRLVRLPEAVVRQWEAEADRSPGED